MAFPAIRTYIISHPPVQNTGVTPKSVSDSGIGTDAVSILVSANVADSGIGTDNISLLAQIALQDKVISDNFDENYTNKSFWTTYGGDAQVKIQNSELEISTIANQSNYFELETVGQYDFTNSSAQVQIIDAGNQALTSYETIMYLQNNADATNKVYFTISQNQLNVRKIVAGTNSFVTGIAYSSTTMKYLRIRRSSGTFYFDYSADAVSWTNLSSFADPFTVTNMNIGLQAGNWQSETQAGTSKFDNFVLILGMTIDVVSVLPQITLSDSGIGTDTIALLAQIVLSDSGTATDAIALLVAIALSDLGSAVDAISLLVALAITDSGSGIDIVSVIAALAVNDTGIGADALAILALIALADSGNATDALSILVQFSLSDTGVGTDAASLLSIISQVDIGIGSDAMSLLAMIIQSEIGQGNESISIQSQVPIIDSGVGIDQVAIQSSVPMNDSGQGTDTVSVIAAIPLSDSGQGSENISIFTQINLTDSGIGTESIVVLLKLLLAENGKAVETLALYKNVRETFVSAGKLFTRLGGGLFVKDH